MSDHRFEKEQIEAMVTAVLAGDAAAQETVLEDVVYNGRAYVQAAASIVAGVYTAIAQQTDLTPLEAWQYNMSVVTKNREK